jgi:glutaredoxin 3
MARVEIFASPLCGYCRAALALLEKKGIAYKKRPILFLLFFKFPNANWHEMVRRSGGRRDIPQIFVDGNYLGDEEALFALQEQGRLQEVLGG